MHAVSGRTPKAAAKTAEKDGDDLTGARIPMSGAIWKLFQGGYLDRHLPFEGFLTEEQETALIARWKREGRESDRREILRCYRPMVLRLAAKARKVPGITLEDAEARGLTGLDVALSKFDLGRDNRFATYAAWWVRAEINELIYDNLSIVSSSTKELRKRIYRHFSKVRNAVDIENPHAVGDERDALIAARMSEIVSDRITVEDVREGHALSTVVVSLSPSESGDDDRKEYDIDSLADDGPSPEDIVVELDLSANRRRIVEAGLSALNERERDIVVSRYLGAEEDRLAQAELATRYGVSRERIRQIETGAFNKMRAAIKQNLDEASMSVREVC